MAGQRLTYKRAALGLLAQADFTGQNCCRDRPIYLHKSATCHISRIHFTPIAADDLMGTWWGGLANFSSCLVTAGAAGEQKEQSYE
jgi:hypothetical protein